MKPNFPDRLVEKVALRVYEGLATPFSLKVAEMLRERRWDDLASAKIDPRHYYDAESYWRDATASGLLRKLEELPTSFDRKAVAEENFVKCEQQCLRTNRRLMPYLLPHWEDAEEGVHAVFRRARKIISDILGKPPEFFEGKFGPGATYGDRGRLTTIPDKMSSVPTLTPDAKYHLLQWHFTAWARAHKKSGRGIEYIRGNRFTTVPKDCTKDRGIAIEPSLNVFYQLGVGKAIRRRLKTRANIDLAQGQDTHRQVACEASIRGHLATLDLSNASDTVSRNLVRLLLPAEWFEILDDLRSKRTEFRGGWHLLEKFSSMGNGFTFELETLIFLGLSLAVLPDSKPGVDVFVYGDDIIVPTGGAKDVISCLEFCGMTINEEKSFVGGPFRESCGGDFFLGVDVRPFFLKELPVEPQQLIAFANGLRRASSTKDERWRESPSRWETILRPERFVCLRQGWFAILDAIPSQIRSLRGPPGLGDLVVNDGESSWRTRQRHGIRYIRVYRPCRPSVVGWAHFKPDVTLATAVYGLNSGSQSEHVRQAVSDMKERLGSGGVVPRAPKLSYKIGWVTYS